VLEDPCPSFEMGTGGDGFPLHLSLALASDQAYAEVHLDNLQLGFLAHEFYARSAENKVYTIAGALTPDLDHGYRDSGAYPHGAVAMGREALLRIWCKKVDNPWLLFGCPGGGKKGGFRCVAVQLTRNGYINVHGQPLFTFLSRKPLLVTSTLEEARMLIRFEQEPGLYPIYADWLEETAPLTTRHPSLLRRAAQVRHLC
jgi:hypothetical protein